MTTNGITKRVKDNNKILLLILCSMILSFHFNFVSGQPCGPTVLIIEKQILTDDGVLILFKKWANYGTGWSHICISNIGEIMKDSCSNFDWKEKEWKEYKCNTENTEIKIKDISNDIVITEIIADSEHSNILSKWIVKGENWEFKLDGSIFRNQNSSPLITLKDNLLYVTVYNTEWETCKGYGKDVIPLVYCIDIREGKILWEQMLL